MIFQLLGLYTEEEQMHAFILDLCKKNINKIAYQGQYLCEFLDDEDNEIIKIHKFGNDFEPWLFIELYENKFSIHNFRLYPNEWFYNDFDRFLSNKCILDKRKLNKFMETHK